MGGGARLFRDPPADLSTERLPVQRRRLRDLHLGGETERLLRFPRPPVTGLARAQVGLRHRVGMPLQGVDERFVRQVACHRLHAPASAPRRRRRFPRAWKKFAFTVPTVEPRIAATSSWLRSWYTFRINVARCFSGSRRTASRTMRA